ncbi:MAG: hypothetical protein R3B40_07740 [Polyangiales bacterium]|nr:hypothetical protein [Myxococcales bacterium]MCB9660644.1 hypothetical protein [Sandaracinaceae bacterium]
MSNRERALLRGRVRVPLARLREALRSSPVQLTLEPAGARLRVLGTVTALSAPITFSTELELSGLVARGDARLLTVRFHDTTASVPDDAPGPLAKTLRAGDVDLAQVGDRVAAQLGLPAFIVSARGNAVTLDLMRVPWLSAGERALVARAVRLGTQGLTVSAVRVVGDALELQLALLPLGITGFARAAVAELLLPALTRFAEGGPS